VTREKLGDAEYERLLTLRTGLRRFLRWSSDRAEKAGLTPAQHQLLLVVRGFPDGRGPTIGDVAEQLLLRHHSVVGLVQRAEAAGLVRRVPDDKDGRVVRLRLSAAGEAALEGLTALHLEELHRLADDLRPLWEGIEPASRTKRDAGAPARAAREASAGRSRASGG
jgi:DNA-binding MarR family transcriptional regulator